MFAIDNTATIPERKAVARPLSDLASNIKATLAAISVGQAFTVPGVYTAEDMTTLRAAKEGGKRPPSTEQAIKVRALGTLAGKMAAQLGFACRVADKGNGSVNVFKVEKEVKAEKAEAAG